MAIINSAITSTGTDIYTAAGSGQEHAVTCIIFCNISASDAILTVHVVPSTGVVQNTNKIINNLTIPAAETFTFDTEKMILESGDRFYAIADANSRLVATVSHMRVS